jgi:hypothetical protein
MAARPKVVQWLRIGAVVLALLALLGFVACRIVGSIFRARLAAMVRKDLNAELVTGSVLYRPPYSFVASHVRIVRPTGFDAGELLRADKLWVTLAHFPHKGEPPEVKAVSLEGAAFQPRLGSLPLARLDLSIHSTGPNVYACELHVNDGAAASGEASGSIDVKRQVGVVQKVSVRGNLGTLLSKLPTSDRARARLSEFAPNGNITASGSAEVPWHDLRQTRYSMNVDVADGGARVKDVRRSFEHGQGHLVIRSGSPADGSPFEATLDHFDIAAGTAQIRLGGGRLTVWPEKETWKLSEVVGSVVMGRELPVSLERSGWFFEQAEFRGAVEFTAAASGPTHFPPGNPLAVIRHDVLVYPHELRLKPRNFQEPIENVSGGPIAFRGGAVAFQNLSGTCGGDKLLLRNARLTLWEPARKIKLDDLRTQIKFEEIAGTVVFSRPVTPYPSALGKTIAALRPAGSFVVGGGSWYALNRPPKDDPGHKLKPDFFIHLIGDGGSFIASQYNVPLDQIHGEATIAPINVEITHFDAKSLGGTAWVEGMITPGKPFLYDGQVEVRDIDLRQLTTLLDLGEPARSRLSGIGFATAHVAGAGRGGMQRPSDTFTADGELQILHGDFSSVPPVGAVAGQLKQNQELGIGDAAAVFHIANRLIDLPRAAVSAPLMGLQGQGTVGFDRSLYLTIVAAPLGDWRDQMRQAKIPIVGDVLGAVQQLLNTVQGALLYQFRVTGTVDHPIKSLIPAPIISDPMALLFGQMLGQDQNGQLLRDVKSSVPQTQPAAAKSNGR